MRVTVLCLAAAVGFVSAVPAMSMTLESPGLAGTTYAAWDFSDPNIQSDWNSTGPWTAIAPTSANDGGAAGLEKISGTAYPLPGLIYTSGSTSELSLSVDPAISGLKNVALQIVTGASPFGDISSAPALSLNGDSQEAADSSKSYSLGEVPTPGFGDVAQTLWLFQWDLSDETTTIDSFAINWSQAPHSQIYAVRIDQSDVFANAVVPEPASLALISLGGLVLLRRKRQ